MLLLQNFWSSELLNFIMKIDRRIFCHKKTQLLGHHFFFVVVGVWRPFTDPSTAIAEKKLLGHHFVVGVWRPSTNSSIAKMHYWKSLGLLGLWLPLKKQKKKKNFLASVTFKLFFWYSGFFMKNASKELRECNRFVQANWRPFTNLMTTHRGYFFQGQLHTKQSVYGSTVQFGNH